MINGQSSLDRSINFRFKEIFDYIANDSIRYTTITSNKIYQNVQLITNDPFVGRIVPESNETFIRELIEGNYRIIYKIKSDIQVDVLKIYHSARLLKRKNIK